MQITDLLKRYENHPLGTVIKSLENTQEMIQLHRFYISAKTMILLLEYQQELSKVEADALETHIQERVDLLVKPENASKRYS